jgi:hypothetical protein
MPTKLPSLGSSLHKPTNQTIQIEKDQIFSQSTSKKNTISQLKEQLRAARENMDYDETTGISTTHKKQYRSMNQSMDSHGSFSKQINDIH